MEENPLLQYAHRAEDQAASRWWEANPFASSSPSNHDVDSAAKDAIVHMPDCSPPTQTGWVIHILEVCCSFEHQNLENINQFYRRKLSNYEAIPAKLMNPGRQQSFPFSSVDYRPIIFGSRGFVPTQTLKHLADVFSGSANAKTLVMTAARECAKEAIIGSIQIARQATCTEFHPIPARAVFPGTMVANIILSGPDVEIQQGQRAPPANIPLGSLLPASASHSSEDDSSDDDSSEPSEPSSSSDDEVELPERP